MKKGSFYDTALDITWLRDANVNGPMDWDTANTWTNTLVVGGVGGWRLPTIVGTGELGFNADTASSELAHLNYVTPGNLGLCPPPDATCADPQPGYGLTNTGNFQNLQSGGYWIGSEYNVNNVWYFVNLSGGQWYGGKIGPLFAMAVHPGDVAAAIPEPHAYALMLMGLGALSLALRRRLR